MYVSQVAQVSLSPQVPVGMQVQLSVGPHVVVVPPTTRLAFSPRSFKVSLLSESFLFRFLMATPFGSRQPTSWNRETVDRTGGDQAIPEFCGSQETERLRPKKRGSKRSVCCRERECRESLLTRMGERASPAAGISRISVALIRAHVRVASGAGLTVTTGPRRNAGAALRRAARRRGSTDHPPGVFAKVLQCFFVERELLVPFPHGHSFR